MTTYRLGELFCGPGGIAWGATHAKIENPNYRIVHAWANDYDKDTCETYRENIENANKDDVICADIRKLDLTQFTEIDAFAFGFPCNDFSVVGEQKGFKGTFGPLYTYGIKVLKHYKPQWFLAENVGGLASANDGSAFQKIMADMRECGYKLYPHLYKFEEYGIPQARHRIIIVGIKNDLSYEYKVPNPNKYSDIDNTCKTALEVPPISNNALNNELTKQSLTVTERLTYIKPGENAFTAEIPFKVDYIAPPSGVAELVKDDGKDSENCEYETKPQLDISVTNVNGDYLQTGWKWTKTLADGITTVSGTITDYKDLVITGNTTIEPVFAKVPFVVGNTDSNGYVKVAEGTTAGTIGTDTTSKYEWGASHVGDCDAVVTFVAKDHYKIKSITMQTPNGTDTAIKNVPLTTTDLTSIISDMVMSGGAATMSLGTPSNGNYTSGEIDLTKVDKSAVFTINFEKITWDVDFDTLGGSTAPATQTIDDGDKVNIPADPSKKGYTFKGWYTDSGCTTKYDFDDKVTKDLTLYAKWEENNVDINYVSNNTSWGTVDNDNETLAAATGTAAGSTATNKTGYKFVNWTKGGTEVSDEKTFVPSKNDGLYEAATYQANFVPITYDVVFDNNTGSGTMNKESFVYDVNKSLTTNTFTKTGYTFQGWAESSTGAVKYTNGESVKNLSSTDGDEITLYAVWKANTNTPYKVIHYTENIEGGYSVEDTENKTGTTDTQASVSENTYTGFTFDPSATTYEKTGTAASSTKLDIASDGSLVIKLYYTRDDYTLSFEMNGHGTQVNDQTLKYEESANKPADPVASGYTFNGWYKDAALTTTYDFDGPVTKDTKVYAKWTANDYTVTYEAPDADNPSDVPAQLTNKHINDEITVSTSVPVRTGYTFTGWTVKSPASLTITSGKFNMPAGNVVLEANWTANTYRVHFDGNTATSGNMNDQNMTYDTKVTLSPMQYSKPGYYFAGWATTAGGTPVYTDGQTVKNLTAKSGGEVKLYAIWTQANPVVVDPPVSKKITGDTPKTKSEFKFKMKALTAGAPMPAGSNGDEKTMSIKGSGSVEFGNIIYTSPGTYEYEISEVKGSADGYTYDDSVYKLTVNVTQVGLELVATSSFTNASGSMVNDCIFSNKFSQAKADAAATKRNKNAGKVTGISSGVDTADQSPVEIMILLMGIGLAGLGATIVTRRKRRTRRNIS